MTNEKIEQTEVMEPTVEHDSKAKRCRKKKSNNYAVTNEELAYKIIDAGLLCELRGIKNREPRVWYFNRNPDVKAVIDQFQAAGGAA